MQNTKLMNQQKNLQFNTNHQGRTVFKLAKLYARNNKPSPGSVRKTIKTLFLKISQPINRLIK